MCPCNAKIQGAQRALLLLPLHVCSCARSGAASPQEYFIKYYDSCMPLMTNILTHASGEGRTVRSPCLVAATATAGRLVALPHACSDMSVCGKGGQRRVLALET